jgi:hypothetical protein
VKFKTKYRIVTDNYAGFEAQFKPWYSPFWTQCNTINSSISVERARIVIDKHCDRQKKPPKIKVVEHYNPSN